ncbi:MAG: MFS transporter [Myxococcota bacterium]
MPSLSESRRLRLLTFTALYFAQGVPWGFISVGYVVLLADLGLDNTAVGAAIGLAYLPWSFKILWGPLLDAVPPLRVGRRRPFIVFAELMMGLTLVAMMPLDPLTQLPWISLLLFLHNTFASLQDVAVDALAVELLEEAERGRANALMWASKSLGVALGGGGGTVLAKSLGWSNLFIVMALCIWAIVLLPLLLRERPPSADDTPVDARLLRLGWFLVPFAAVGAVMWGLSTLDRPWVPIVQPFAALAGALAAWPLVDRTGFGQLQRSFSFATPWWGIAAAVFTPAGYALVSIPMTRMIRADLQLSEERIAFLTGVVDPAAGVVGALVGGLLADRLGARPTVGALMGGIAACLAVFGLTEAWWPSYGFLIGWTIAQMMLVNGYNAGMLSLYQGLSNPRIGATHFAVYMAATNLTYAWASPLGGLLADTWGFPVLFGIAATVQLATIALVSRLDVVNARTTYSVT